MRGGMGIRRDYHLLADQSDGMYYVEQTVRRSAPAAARAAAPARRAARGVPGGHGRPVPCRARATSICTAATCCQLVGAGGGGFGAPPGSAVRR